jgi:hypothetical protein
MNDKKEKRMVADTGYEVKHAIHIGDREIIVAIDMNAPNDRFYMFAEYRDMGIIGQYDHIIYCHNYLTIMDAFSKAIAAQIDSLQKEFSATNYQDTPITAKDCYPHDYGEDLKGKVVAIKAGVLRPEYRRADKQLVLVDSGGGSGGNAHGTAMFCYRLDNGQHTRFERYDVLGVVKELPKWAKERSDSILAKQRAEAEKDKTEIVAGYTITWRIQTGGKLFVMGENPEAVSPYATWQRFEGRTGYDIGHYFDSREKAIEDLHTRADQACENIMLNISDEPSDNSNDGQED